MGPYKTLALNPAPTLTLTLTPAPTRRLRAACAQGCTHWVRVPALGVRYVRTAYPVVITPGRDGAEQLEPGRAAPRGEIDKQRKELYCPLERERNAGSIDRRLDRAHPPTPTRPTHLPTTVAARAQDRPASRRRSRERCACPARSRQSARERHFTVRHHDTSHHDTTDPEVSPYVLPTYFLTCIPSPNSNTSGFRDARAQIET